MVAAKYTETVKTSNPSETRLRDSILKAGPFSVLCGPKCHDNSWKFDLCPTQGMMVLASNLVVECHQGYWHFMFTQSLHPSASGPGSITLAARRLLPKKQLKLLRQGPWKRPVVPKFIFERESLSILVGGLEHFFNFPYIAYIGNNHPSWLIFFRGDQRPNQNL